MGFFKKHFDPKIDQVPIRILEIFFQIRKIQPIWPYKHQKKHTVNGCPDLHAKKPKILTFFAYEKQYFFNEDVRIPKKHLFVLS